MYAELRRNPPSQLPLHRLGDWDGCQAHRGTVKLVGCRKVAGLDNEVDVGDAADQA